MPPIQLLIKPASGSCNLRCRYCFYEDEMSLRSTANYGIMSLETLEAVVEKSLAYADRSCGFTFQGGEPTLAGLDFFRELMRLEASLKAAGEREKYCFLHYPPLYQGYRCQEILDLLEAYGVRRCFYGHLHGGSHRLAISGQVGSVEYRLIAADFLGFRPEKLLD